VGISTGVSRGMHSGPSGNGGIDGGKIDLENSPMRAVRLV
jgi:hypothetical protein